MCLQRKFLLLSQFHLLHLLWMCRYYSHNLNIKYEATNRMSTPCIGEFFMKM
uniref:Uncharacterized protein n=1 Tax=Rhizophora mucronata TaxID=61149 RepID=A0A2P2MW72_RHIMU